MAHSKSDLAIYCKESVVRGITFSSESGLPLLVRYSLWLEKLANTEDQFAVAVTKNDIVVGYVPLPRKFSALPETQWHNSM